MSDFLHPSVNEYLDACYEPLNEELRALRAKAEAERVPVILRDSEAFLMMLIKLKKPQSVLEIGTAVAYSALCFATEAEVTSIERDPEMYAQACKNAEGHGNVKLICGEALDVLAKLDKKYDFFFIDAGKSHYKEYFEACLKLANRDAVIVCDNILFHGRTASDDFDPSGRYKTNTRKMRAFVDYLKEFRDAYTVILSTGDGMSVSLLKTGAEK